MLQTWYVRHCIWQTLSPCRNFHGWLADMTVTCSRLIPCFRTCAQASVHHCSFNSAISSKGFLCVDAPRSLVIVCKLMGRLVQLPGMLLHASAFVFLANVLNGCLCRLSKIDLSLMQLPADIVASFLSRSCSSTHNDRCDIVVLALSSIVF